MWVVFWHPAYMLEDRGRKTQHRGLKLIRNDIKIKGQENPAHRSEINEKVYQNQRGWEIKAHRSEINEK